MLLKLIKNMLRWENSTIKINDSDDSDSDINNVLSNNTTDLSKLIR